MVFVHLFFIHLFLHFFMWRLFCPVATSTGTNQEGGSEMSISPWVVGLIDHHRSFLLVRALFSLADPNVERIKMGYLTFFIDMVYYIQEEWDILLSSIHDGLFRILIT